MTSQAVTKLCLFTISRTWQIQKAPDLENYQEKHHADVL